MEKVEKKMNYQLKSGNEIIGEANSLPKLAKICGCNLSWFYTHKPKNENDSWEFNYKGFKYQIIKLK